MKQTNVNSFHVVGVFTKTTNENQKAAKDIPALWQKFMTEETGLKVKDRISDEIVCAYFDYEGDHMKPYSCLVGYKVKSLKSIPEGMKGITIPNGNYNKFLAKGDLTGSALWTAWTNIWKAKQDRSYDIDFELYTEKSYPIQNGEADIYIGLN